MKKNLIAIITFLFLCTYASYAPPVNTICGKNIGGATFNILIKPSPRINDQVTVISNVDKDPDLFSLPPEVSNEDFNEIFETYNPLIDITFQLEEFTLSSIEVSNCEVFDLENGKMDLQEPKYYIDDKTVIKPILSIPLRDNAFKILPNTNKLLIKKNGKELQVLNLEFLGYETDKEYTNKFLFSINDETNYDCIRILKYYLYNKLNGYFKTISRSLANSSPGNNFEKTLTFLTLNPSISRISETNFFARMLYSKNFTNFKENLKENGQMLFFSSLREIDLVLLMKFLITSNILKASDIKGNNFLSLYRINKDGNIGILNPRSLREHINNNDYYDGSYNSAYNPEFVEFLHSFSKNSFVRYILKQNKEFNLDKFDSYVVELEKLIQRKK